LSTFGEQASKQATSNKQQATSSKQQATQKWNPGYAFAFLAYAAANLGLVKAS
jgi:hypothetical protein